MQKFLFLSIFLGGCSYDVRSEAKNGEYCDLINKQTGGLSQHFACDQVPWTNISSGLSCVDAPAEVGSSCQLPDGAVGVVEDY